MNRTKRGRSREAAIAVIGTTPGDMLDAIIERAEAVRTGYLARLSEPQPRHFSRRRYQQMLTVMELRLNDLRANRDDRERPA